MEAEHCLIDLQAVRGSREACAFRQSNSVNVTLAYMSPRRHWSYTLDSLVPDSLMFSSYGFSGNLSLCLWLNKKTIIFKMFYLHGIMCFILLKMPQITLTLIITQGNHSKGDDKINISSIKCQTMQHHSLFLL